MDTGNLSTVLLLGLVILMIASFISVLVLYFIRPKALIGLLPSEGSLEKPTKVGSVEIVRDNFFQSPGSTFSCHIYCSATSKSGSLTKDTIPLVQFGKSVRFEIVPGGVSSQPTAQLTVLTQGTKVETESLSVKSFPMQQWVYLSIIREGRRFTIYYNGEAVFSERLTYFPLVVSSPLILGDPRLRGYFAGPKLAPIVLDSSEIVSNQKATSDTRKKPYMSNPTWSLSDFFSFGCPNGIFCFSTSSPPNDPTKVWKTSYA